MNVPRRWLARQTLMDNHTPRISNRGPTGFIGEFILVVCLCVTPAAPAAWMDAAFAFRREVTLSVDAEKSAGGDVATATVFTAGRHKEDGSDVRVATEDGKMVPFRLLGVGPGDQVRVAFGVQRAQRRYYVYFGNPNPAASAKPRDELAISGGLLMEMKQWPGGGGHQAENAQQIMTAFDRAKAPIGSIMVDKLFIGRNPFGDAHRFVSRFSGSLYVPNDGDYLFAAAANDRGLLVIDGKPLLVCHMTHEARFTANANLKKGRHDIAFYHVNIAGADGLVSVAWRKPGASGFELLPADAFGKLFVATPGAMEENRKTLTADFKVEYLGETFFAGNYGHRFRFSANVPKTQPPHYEWDFGDGQTGEGNLIEHVYLTHGVYPVKVTARIASNNDSQTTKLSVARDYMSERIRVDEPIVQSKLVEGYKLEKLMPAHLPWAVLLHQRTGRLDPMLKTAAQLAITPRGFDPLAALHAMEEATATALNNSRIDAMLKIWDTVPASSAMQPSADKLYGRLLVWRAAEFDKACKILARQSGSTDRTVQRLYAHSLVLNQKAAEGKKILQSLPLEGPADRQAAISGAMARTVEFYIESGDAETGEDAWDKWQRQYPLDFMEGYSVLLRVRLIEARKMPEVAAKVAEAFALAVPRSTYAPSLLDRASKLLAKSNPQKSADLRKILKQKYPEDPLSQDK